MKVNSDKDTNCYKKISIIDELGASMSYNAAADYHRWSDLSMRLRLKWWKNYTFSMNAQFATYAYELDANGKVKDLLNYTEVQTQVSKLAMASIDSLYKAKPEMEKTLPKYKMAMSINSLLTKEAFIESAENNTFFILFGKTLKTGDKVDMNKQGIKTTVTYEVNKEPNALNIIGKIKGNMTEDDVKAFFIDKMKQIGADEAMVSKLDANWGQMKQMGMAKMDVDGTSTTKLLNSGWATEYSTDVKTKMMGMEMTINSVTKLVEHSWK